MRFSELSSTERRALVSFMTIVSLLGAGLLVSGVWLFLFDKPTFNDNTFFGDKSGGELSFPRVIDVHGTIADVFASCVFIAVAWWCYRVLASISWRAVGAVAIVWISVITGGFISVTAVIRGEQVVSDLVGYLPILTGDFDWVEGETGRRNAGSFRLWSLAHFAGPLLLIALALINRNRRRPTDSSTASWLDQLDRQDR